MPTNPRFADVPDYDWMLALNKEHEVELSPLSIQELAALVEQADFGLVVDKEAAFLIALAHTASYDSPNFLWLKAHVPTFLYVDRIVVSKISRGRGVARLLYEHLFEAARAKGVEQIVCEVNSFPPNPQSDAFHKALGFSVIGEAELVERGKRVTYLSRAL